MAPLVHLLFECSCLLPHDSVDSSQVQADDGSEVSRDVSTAHLRQLKLQRWNDVDSEVLRTCFSIVSRYSSLEELLVQCNTPGEHSLAAEFPCNAFCSFTSGRHYLFEWLARQFSTPDSTVTK